ncbi:prolyl-tRNA editing enzyme YbaK/EbsC (Cys-tRNA(Pro) deacylase) [Rubricella aquisinus]|uniref:Prolyl-tRNA editing enzyme YbaK/EbsC (Cys-tRNA(Pro) deacylase) n=1 Tax=Rubricella aquisinus TaxID=2028108 RepID=A0A840WWN4_9RHOB|nr:YbaK/EbsC family protein [Rubricella aquisinus]MBB5514724.1 prolyl-tRNA editing enzyme YbaK/EbsC (Cys-tRNA(Pro) deacylase) [Rubricella aquisinus]
MSKSVKRVRAALGAADLPDTIQEMPDSTRTAVDAAAACGCTVAQIVKSMIFATEDGAFVLFLTAGDNQVDPAKAAKIIGAPLSRAEPNALRSYTGFAIGGVAPIGHLNPVTCVMDPDLMQHDTVWAAAGTPRHVFSIAPDVLQRITGARVESFTA